MKREFDDDMPYLFGCHSSGNDLFIRLDRTFGYDYQTHLSTVLEIRLRNCARLEQKVGEVNAKKGELVWAIDFQNDRGNLKLSFENGTEIEFECERVEENDSDFTTDEFGTKIALLNEELKRVWDEYTNLSRKNMVLNQMLDHELRKEAGNAEEKQEFFRNKDPARSEAFGHVVRLCSKLLNLKDGILRDNERSS